MLESFLSATSMSLPFHALITRCSMWRRHFWLGEAYRFPAIRLTIAAFGKHFVHTGIVPVEFHRFLIDAQDDRITGDYAIVSGLNVDDAKEQLERAARFIEVAEALLKQA